VRRMRLSKMWSLWPATVTINYCYFLKIIKKHIQRLLGDLHLYEIFSLFQPLEHMMYIWPSCF
jgi:hypothetical protein